MHRGWGGRPKITALLAEPDAAVARQLVKTAREAQVAPTIFLGLRMRTTTYVYDDPVHADRPTGTIESPAYVPEDRALLMGLASYESSLCKCGEPRSVAWHTEMDGFYDDTHTVVCFACSALSGGEQKVTYSVLANTRDPGVHGPMPAFVLGVTTTDS